MAGWLAVVAILVNFVLPSWVTSTPLNMYLAQPLLWGSAGLLALWARRREEGRIGLPAARWLVGGALLVGLFQVMLLWLAGFLAGFGHSPYSREPVYVGLNLWFVAVRLAGLEFARWHLINALGRRRALLGGTVVWLLLTLAGLPLHAFTNLPSGSSTLDFLGGIVAPIAGQNMLATYLAAVGGPLASMAYMGTLQFFEWVPPILPSLDWTFALFLGLAVPTIGLMVVRDLNAWRTPADGAEKEETTGSSSGALWVAAAAAVVFLIWFNTGMFGVRPALVAGQSMEPTMWLGDVAITRQVPIDDIKIGDIVTYQRGGISVVHRVLSIQNDSGQTVFVTKGDNNNAEDPPVQANQIQGKMVVFLPKVGWIGVAVKSLVGLVH